MPTKIELTLEQSQQGVSDDVLNHKMIAGIEDRRHGPSDPMHNPSQPFRWQSAPASVFTVTNGNPSRVNIKQLCGRYKHRSCSLVPANSDSLPHTYTQALNVIHSAYFPIIKDP
ncbi:hypothetical protein Tco_0328741 [Tanacetum coccineum]